MQPKSCNCGQPARYSLSFLISTLGLNPRQQKTTTAVVFCDSCIQGALAAMETTAPTGMLQPLRSTYTKFNEHFREALHAVSANDSQTPSIADEEGTTNKTRA
jgi:hypothetical protein